MQPYPLILETDENGTVIAQALDVPEAITVGRDAEEAAARAEDALVAGLSGYIDDGRAIPRPSRRKRGQACAVLPPMAAAKLAIYQAMRTAGLTEGALAERLGCDPLKVRRRAGKQCTTPSIRYVQGRRPAWRSRLREPSARRGEPQERRQVARAQHREGAARRRHASGLAMSARAVPRRRLSVPAW